MDYRKLLKIYINHVISEEGYAFNPSIYDVEFTNEQYEEITTIIDEVLNERSNRTD